MKTYFADNLKKLRKERGLSQEELADRLSVSRQSISKWESSQAYPEMDKLLQLCSIFNIKIDELLNQNISDVKEKVDSRNKINKYIDDFLKFITKTINMFTSMKLKEKFKCLFEQIIIILILIFVYALFGDIIHFIFSSILDVLPSAIYSIICRLFNMIYSVIYTILALVIFIHIFKTRYLDYYEIINGLETDELPNNSDKIEYIQNKKEKIIIRDPKHTEYRFVNGLLKMILFIFKCFIGFIFALLSAFLVFLVFVLFSSLYHSLDHSLFIGISICFVAFIIIDILFMILLFCFIFNKKTNIKRIFVIFIIALIIGGIGVSSSFISFINLKYKDVICENTDNLIKTYEFNDNTYIDNSSNEYKFLVDNNLKDEIKINIKYNKEINSVKLDNKNNYISLSYDNNIDNIFSFYKNTIKGLKKNIIYNYIYDGPSITITTSENNIRKLIEKLSNEEITNLIIKNNEYNLIIDGNYYDGKNICYLKDNYYHDCINVYVDDYDISSFSYNQDGFHYDSNKYVCKGNKQKYCYLKDDYE